MLEPMNAVRVGPDKYYGVVRILEHRARGMQNDSAKNLLRGDAISGLGACLVPKILQNFSRFPVPSNL
jgi:hypothetical protein